MPAFGLAFHASPNTVLLFWAGSLGLTGTAG